MRIFDKTFSWPKVPKIKRWINGQFLRKTMHGVTPLEKSQFFDFFNLLFLQHRETFFCSRISSNPFSLPILSRK